MNNEFISIVAPKIIEYLFDESKTLCMLEQVNKQFSQFFEQSGWKHAYSLWIPPTQIALQNVDSKELYVRRFQVQQQYLKQQFSRRVVEEHGDSVTAVCIHPHHHNPNLSSTLYEDKPIALSGSKSGRCVAFDLLTKDLQNVYGFIQPSKLIAMYPVLTVPNAFAVCSQGNKGSENMAEMVILDSFTTKVLDKQRVYSVDEQEQPLVEFFEVDLSGNYFVIAAEEFLKIWKRKEDGNFSLELLHSISSTHSNGVKHMHFVQDVDSTTDSPLLVTSGMDSAIKVWNAKTGQCIKTMNHDGLVNHVVSAKGILASGGSDCNVKVFDFKTGTLLATLDKHKKPICALDMSPNAHFIVSASRDKTVVFWKRQNKVFKVTKQIKLDASPSFIICNPWIALIPCQDGTIYFYSYDGKLLDKNKPSDSNFVSYAKDPLHQYLIFGHHDSSCSIFDFTPKKKWERVSAFEQEEDVLEDYKKRLYDPLRQTYTSAPSKTWKDYPKEFDQKITVKHILQDKSPDVMVFKNVLTKQECEHFINETEAIGYEACYGYHPSYRSNTRIIIEDANLGGIIFERIKDFLPQTWSYGGSKWKLQKLNDALRFCRYIPGQHFSPHVDGHFELDINHRSFLTFMIYLNGGFVGGNTNFLGSNKTIKEAVEPESGLLLVFPHDIYHEGAKVEGGCNKYIMRSDVLYERIK